MKIKSVKISNYRNVQSGTELKIKFSDDLLHFITGPNLSGKTNILEGINLLKYFQGYADLKRAIKSVDYNDASLPIKIECMVSAEISEWQQFLPSHTEMDGNVANLSIKIGPFDSEKNQASSINKQLDFGKLHKLKEFQKENSSYQSSLITTVYIPIERGMDDLKISTFNNQFKELVDNLGLGEEFKKVGNKQKINRWVEEFSEILENKFHIKNAPGLKKFLGNVCSDISFSFFDSSNYINLLKSLKFTLEIPNNGEKIIIDRTSYGLQQILLIYFALRAIIHGGKQKVPVIIILVDEPEISLHPYWQFMFRELFSDLDRTVGGGKIKTVIATHSTHMIQEHAVQAITKIQKEDSDKNVKGACILDDSRKYINSELAELFFIKKVYLCEGGDKFLLRALERCECKNRDNTAFLNSGGKYAIPDLLSWVIDLNLDFKVIFDFDVISNTILNKIIEMLKKRKKISKLEINKIYKRLEKINEVKSKVLELLANKSNLQLSSQSYKSVWSELENSYQGKIVAFDEISKNFKTSLIVKNGWYKYLSEDNIPKDLVEVFEKNVNELIELLKKFGIFILSNGEIENYLTSKAKELHSSKEYRLLLIERDSYVNKNWVNDYIIPSMQEELKNIVCDIKNEKNL